MMDPALASLLEVASLVLTRYAGMFEVHFQTNPPWRKWCPEGL
jgi:hypothetical protein